MTLKTATHAHEAADIWATEAVSINEVKARQLTEKNDMVKRHKTELAERTKKHNSLKTKIANFAKKYGEKIFGGKQTGTCKTKLASVTLRNNPAKLVQIDKKETEAELIERAKASGYSHVIVTTEALSKESLERLTDNQLETLGFMRESTFGFDMAPIVEPKLKA